VPRAKARISTFAKCTLDERPKPVHQGQTHLLVREDVTQELLAQEFSWKRFSDGESQGATHEDKMIGCRPPVVKYVWL
jgi:hypothetical protein